MLCSVLGFRPHFHCKALNDSVDVGNASDLRHQYDQCKIKTYENTSDGEVLVSETKCLNGWDYDIPVKQSFVTEVCLTHSILAPPYDVGKNML